MPKLLAQRLMLEEIKILLRSRWVLKTFKDKDSKVHPVTFRWLLRRSTTMPRQLLVPASLPPFCLFSTPLQHLPVTSQKAKKSSMLTVLRVTLVDKIVFNLRRPSKKKLSTNILLVEDLRNLSSIRPPMVRTLCQLSEANLVKMILRMLLLT